ncbi:serine/arginine-rich SC35-like splicing factor SCL30 [Lactuca sativa]|uniref:RRM domain-containing protein n=1 Tax=Lactuca sativa TaxID=4236 RepID=A0A9R1WGH4_LACSA|nr:serine/arginine-rich SC35-like splicing factor SCL30 [Lactuca sativa]XP_023757248.1 serine/arginine-rich SC35-like splicing factor SCL30 [Lactuca sativa]XP_023757249.1 serine/arginine-rich SC35-like splicing factor SCL30 [Lactuca sativa]KAJ0223379.1 hypothetical protein LSAT_V11C200094160 [Lactuca sativa]
MRRYSPPYHSPPRRDRGHGGRPRSPPRRAYGGERGRHKDQNHGSLLVRNIPLNCRPEELRVPFERFGVVRDVYLPKNYYTGEPRGFAFVQFVDAYEAGEAQYHMNGRMFAGREISVVLASESRKRPEEMRRRTRPRESSGYEGRRSHHGGRSRSHSRSPRRPSGSRSRQRSRSYSPAPKRRGGDYSESPPPVRREPQVDDDRSRRSYSPGYDDAAANDHNVDRRRSPYKSSGRAARSPSGSRSRSRSRSGDDMSPPPRT